MARRIVVGYDGSDAARDALSAAVDAVESVSDSEILLVCGVDRPPAWIAYGDADGELDAYVTAVEKQLSADLQRAARRVEEAGIKAEIVCRREHPVDLLLSVAHDTGAGWIFVGARGTGATHHVVMGSTTMKLLHHADVPVVVVPERKQGGRLRLP